MTPGAMNAETRSQGSKQHIFQRRVLTLQFLEQQLPRESSGTIPPSPRIEILPTRTHNQPTQLMQLFRLRCQSC